MMKKLFFLILIFLSINCKEKVKHIKSIKNMNDNNGKAYYDYLFEKIDKDEYNISLIYNKFYNSIKIKHKSKIILYKKDVCIFGVLCNDEGLEIEKSMLNWLLPEYDVYCIYQKYPGILFEYPALKFAQWLSQLYNISIILYVHTKGAYNHYPTQEKIRELWKYEFTKNNKKKYMTLLKNNYFDVVLPFRAQYVTWFNGMFISNRAFNLIHEIKYYHKSRWYYESLFINAKNTKNKVRIKGVLCDNILPNQLRKEILNYINNFKMFLAKRKKKIIGKIVIIFSFVQFFIYLKIINLTKNKNIIK